VGPWRGAGGRSHRGAALLIWRERRLAWVLVPAPIAFFIFMGQQQRYFGRWLLPIFPILCLLAAVGAVGAIRALARRRPALAPALAAIALLAQGLVYAVHNDRVLSRPDTRALARAWMVAHLPPGTPMLVEPVAPGAWLSDPGRSFAQTPDGSRWTYVNPLDGPTSSGAIGVAALSAIGGGGLARTLDAGAPGGTTADAASRPAAELLAAVGADPLDDQVGDSTFPYLYTSDLQAVGNESYVRSVSPELINLLEARGVCIIVTGSTVWGRAFNAPKQVPLAVAYYRDLGHPRPRSCSAPPRARTPQSFNFGLVIRLLPARLYEAGPGGRRLPPARRTLRSIERVGSPSPERILTRSRGNEPSLPARGRRDHGQQEGTPSGYARASASTGGALPPLWRLRSCSSSCSLWRSPAPESGRPWPSRCGAQCEVEGAGTRQRRPDLFVRRSTRGAGARRGGGRVARRAHRVARRYRRVRPVHVAGHDRDRRASGGGGRPAGATARRSRRDARWRCLRLRGRCPVLL